MRSYLKRCESALSSMNLSAKRSSSSSSTPVASNDIPIQKPTTSSWYVDELGFEATECDNEFDGAYSKLNGKERRSSISKSDQHRTAAAAAAIDESDCIIKERKQQKVTSLTVRTKKSHHLNWVKLSLFRI